MLTEEGQAELRAMQIRHKQQQERFLQECRKMEANLGRPMSAEETVALINKVLLEPEVVQQPAKVRRRRKRKPGSSQSIRAMRG